MPFHPLPDHEPGKSRPSHIGLLIIRGLVVSTFCYYQLFDQWGFAQDLVWESGEWSLVDQLEQDGFPVPAAIAVGSILLLTIALLGVLSGIFTRVNSLLVTLMMGFVLLAPLDLSATLNPQGLALYIAVFAGLAIGGGGELSLDHVLEGRRAKRRALL